MSAVESYLISETSMRDEFASRALASLLLSREVRDVLNEMYLTHTVDGETTGYTEPSTSYVLDDAQIAANAYDLAEAMLTERRARIKAAKARLGIDEAT